MSMLEPNMSTTMMSQTINSDQQVLNRAMQGQTHKKQLDKVSKEFEAVFITKMLNEMDKTVDREGGIFGEDTKYLDTFKSYMYGELGRQLANNPRTSFGFAKQIYTQMEKYVKD